jgi:hypothetical protein
MLAPDPPINDLAREIVSQVEAEIGKDSRVRSLFTAVETDNIPALRFWIKMGYSIVDGPFWRSDKVAVFMLKKDLPRRPGVNLFKDMKETQMKKVDFYRDKLRSLAIWDGYLMVESGLPGPRANLELAQAVADEGSEELFWRYAGLKPQEAPINTPTEFLAICGVIGLGVLLAGGHPEAALALRAAAGDPRWRVREAVCIGLQGFGNANFQSLLALAREWAGGSWLEKRAAAAALCEPRLLKNPPQVVEVFDILDGITDSLLGDDLQDGSTRVLLQGLSYCWSVAAAAHPVEGKKRMEKWFASEDKTILKIMGGNLKKHRLKKMDPEWVENWTRQVEKSLIRLKNQRIKSINP